MTISRIIAGLFALVPVGCMALYFDYFADFSYGAKPLSSNEINGISGCYKWERYKIDVGISSLKFYHGEVMTIQSPASYQRTTELGGRDVRVTSDIQLQLEPRFMTVNAVHVASNRMFIQTSMPGSKPYFIVSDPTPSNNKFVEFEKSTC